jgi:ketosteroid isomerase-like protein
MVRKGNVRLAIGLMLVFGLSLARPASGAVNPGSVENTSRSPERPSGRERTSDSDSHRILGLEDAWAAALVKRDGAFFRKHLARGFIYTENDHTMGREALLRELTRGSDRVTSAHNERMRVHPFGSVVVVTGWLIVRGHGKDGPFDRRYRFTDTWVRREGEWQIAAAHDYIKP